jgi:trans-aconitate methyltransferase
MDQDLRGALGLTGPDACLTYYRDWAATYDTGFAAGMQYLLPAHVAAAYLATGARGPVLDVGAGTGLLAERLRDMGFPDQIDAVDFSPEMLARAAEKRLYAALFQADITRPLALPQRYSGIVSSGTFTAGHVGPEALPHLLDAALPGAQVALSINRRVWSSAGFDQAMAALADASRIVALQEIEVEIYGAAAARLDADHAADRALIALFRVA